MNDAILLTRTNAPQNLKRTWKYVGEAILFCVFVGFMLAVFGL